LPLPLPLPLLTLRPLAIRPAPGAEDRHLNSLVSRY
jgi:hypothetical protein